MDTKIDICYRCGGKPFLKKYYEIIDGEKRMVCGRCREIICSICGKSKFKDDIKRWTHTIDKETGKMLNFGSCCVTVVGKRDAIKMGIEKYNDVKRINPEIIQQMEQQTHTQKLQRQQLLSNQDVANNLIDNWATAKQNKKIKV